MVGDRFIAGEFARPLPVLNPVSVETESQRLETCLLHGKNAKLLTVLKQLSVEREPYWFETGLLWEKMQSC